MSNEISITEAPLIPLSGYYPYDKNIIFTFNKVKWTDGYVGYTHNCFKGNADFSLNRYTSFYLPSAQTLFDFLKEVKKNDFKTSTYIKLSINATPYFDPPRQYVIVEDNSLYINEFESDTGYFRFELNDDGSFFLLHGNGNYVTVDKTTPFNLTTQPKLNTNEIYRQKFYWRYLDGQIYFTTKIINPIENPPTPYEERFWSYSKVGPEKGKMRANGILAFNEYKSQNDLYTNKYLFDVNEFIIDFSASGLITDHNWVKYYNEFLFKLNNKNTEINTLQSTSGVYVNHLFDLPYNSKIDINTQSMGLNFANLKNVMTSNYEYTRRFTKDKEIVYDSIDRVATPVITPASGSYTTAITVSITCATPGATIRYTTNGSEPTPASPIYTAPFSLSYPTTVKAKAFREGFLDSYTAQQTYNIVIQTVSTPLISPTTSTYYNQFEVQITCATPGATIRYTTNGSNPTSSSTIYNGPFTVSSSTTVKAYATKTDSLDSAIATKTYELVVAAPTIAPTNQSQTGPFQVTISTTTAGATIRYTLDGSNPTSSSTIYNGPFTVSSSTTVKAYATKTGYTNSSITTKSYTITVAERSFSINDLCESQLSNNNNVQDGSTTFENLDCKDNSDPGLSLQAAVNNTIWLPIYGSTHNQVLRVSIDNINDISSSDNTLQDLQANTVKGRFYVSTSASYPSRTIVDPDLDYGVWVGHRTQNIISFLSREFNNNTSQEHSDIKTFGNDPVLKYQIYLGKSSTDKIRISKYPNIIDAHDDTTNVVSHGDTIAKGVRMVVIDKNKNIWTSYQDINRWYKIPRALLSDPNLDSSDFVEYDSSDGVVSLETPSGISNMRSYGAVVSENNLIWSIGVANSSPSARNLLHIVNPTNNNRVVEITGIGSQYGISSGDGRYIILVIYTSNTLYVFDSEKVKTYLDANPDTNKIAYTALPTDSYTKVTYSGSAGHDRQVQAWPSQNKIFFAKTFSNQGDQKAWSIQYDSVTNAVNSTTETTVQVTPTQAITNVSNNVAPQFPTGTVIIKDSSGNERILIVSQTQSNDTAENFIINPTDPTDTKKVSFTTLGSHYVYTNFTGFVQTGNESTQGSLYFTLEPNGVTQSGFYGWKNLSITFGRYPTGTTTTMPMSAEIYATNGSEGSYQLLQTVNINNDTVVSPTYTFPSEFTTLQLPIRIDLFRDITRAINANPAETVTIKSLTAQYRST